MMFTTSFKVVFKSTFDIPSLLSVNNPSNIPLHESSLTPDSE